jgi:hypothetical protein
MSREVKSERVKEEKVVNCAKSRLDEKVLGGKLFKNIFIKF